MNLQETIRRILREELSIRVKRRITPDEMEKEFLESFNSAYDLTKRRRVLRAHFLDELINTTINMMMDGFHWRFTSTIPEDEFWYDEIHTGLENHYRDRIIQMYNERQGINESILREETEGIDSFFNEISEVHDMSDELKEFLKKFIEESNCKRISFSKFKIYVLGLALDSGVLINSMALTRPLPFLLFLIFHEIAHQYQFKKYGVDIMYDCYLDEVSEMEAAKFMKHTEEVADDFAYRKIRELEKLKLIQPYKPPQMYKSLPIQNIVTMISNYKNDMKGKNIDSPKKISEYFYNMVKGEL